MISRSTLLAGPCYVTFGGASFRLAADAKLQLVWEAQNVSDALKGPFTKVVTNRKLVLTGTPLYYDPSNTTTIFFPYISLLATPPGTQIFGTSDGACSVVGNNGLTILMKAAAVTKMPNLSAGADKPILDGIEITGVNATGTDPSSSSSFYTISTSNAFTPPTIPAASVLARQKWSAAYGSVTGFTAFQSYDGFAITHELGLTWVKDNGQDIGAFLTGYRAMCKCTPSANTIAQLAAAMAFSGGSAAQGQRYDSNAADLIISGAISGTITLKNASIESSEASFAPGVLNQGQISFITNVGDNAGANVASLILA